MHIVVPLAGPDFIRADGSLKALLPFHGKPLLQYALESRPWHHLANSISFVLHDRSETRALVSEHLSSWYPDASFSYLSTFTRGAACSALAGAASQAEFHQPLIIDLADIIYTSTCDVPACLDAAPDCGGIALTFTSENPHYSYLRCDDEGRAIEAAEKRVISNNASAGTYIFRDCATYLRALAHALDNEASQVYKNLFYVCPLFNGVLAQGKQVMLEPVHDIVDVKVLGAQT
ncbi:MAG: hypothetical protein VKK97_08740 [Synechococcaceae cyanobacterium]|nr:hypothetical protein [Synechococcaceae cyanobacterium]